MISKLLIEKVISPENIYVFEKPECGIEFIRSYTQYHKKPVILFLDINMPGMRGWDFLEVFVSMNKKTQKLFKVFILTSAIQDFDTEANKFPFIKDFISKPLKAIKLLKLNENFFKAPLKRKLA